MLSIEEGLRRVKDNPKDVTDTVIEKWISGLTRVLERQEGSEQVEETPDVLEMAAGLPKTRRKQVLREELARLDERRERVMSMLKEA